jgi:hypothetical protein
MYSDDTALLRNLHVMISGEEEWCTCAEGKIAIHFDISIATTGVCKREKIINQEPEEQGPR